MATVVKNFKLQEPAHAPETNKTQPARLNLSRIGRESVPEAIPGGIPEVSWKPDRPNTTLVKSISNNMITIYVGMSNVKQFDTFCQVELQVRLPLWYEWAVRMRNQNTYTTSYESLIYSRWHRTNQGEHGNWQAVNRSETISRSHGNIFVGRDVLQANHTTWSCNYKTKH